MASVPAVAGGYIFSFVPIDGLLLLFFFWAFAGDFGSLAECAW